MFRGRSLSVTLIFTILSLAQALTPGRAIAEPSGWPVHVPKHGHPSGETSFTVVFPEPVERAPLTFGIPLGQVASPGEIALLDGEGNLVPADFFPLGDWGSQPARWVLVSCVVDDPAEQDLALKWGAEAPPSTGPMEMVLEGDVAQITNETYAMTVSPQGIRRLSFGGVSLTPKTTWRPCLILKKRKSVSPEHGTLQVLHDGRVMKQVFFTAPPAEGVEVQQEFTFWAGSPFVRCDMRFVNRTTEDIPLRDLSLFEVYPETNFKRVRAGFDGETIFEGAAIIVGQEAFGWRVNGRDFVGEPGGLTTTVECEGAEDNLGEWFALESPEGKRLMVVLPHFQEMAAGERGLVSRYAADTTRFAASHYASAMSSAPVPEVRLRETMARTFTYWLVFNPADGEEAAIARAVKAMPYVAYDREFLTEMGVFQEQAVSHLFDDEVLEAGLYFKRAQVPRVEYPRCSRGADPGPDKSGEGFYEVDLHAGGMVFGETFQYFTPKPDEGLIKRYHEEIGIPLEHIVTGGTCTYRNGDIVLALFQEYLRSGNETLHDFARIHGQVYADVSISHADASKGLGHYYCDWYGNPYVYQRFEGLLLGALVTGDPWWFEVAKDMADYCVRAWKDGEPRDGGLDGGFGGIQYRSPYVAKMLLKMYEVTGEQQYADTAVRLAEWIMPRQEPDGWWRDTPGATREYRCSPIFAGYTSKGLWPLYWATKNEALKESLMKAVDFHVSKQEDVDGHNPGSFPNSYWYAKAIAKDAPIEGNYATTSHWADNILNAYLATGDLKYFYSANAAWVSVLNHQTPEGGVPLSNSQQSSVWSHVMVESLPAFAAVAEERGLPIVLSSKTGVPGTSFMGTSATYEDGIFTFELKYKHDKPVPVRVFSPDGKPAAATLDGSTVVFEYESERRIVTLKLPPSEESRAARIVLEASS